jgi:2-polyprenyl-3-methyl-5-hydroxy-6-metoxy-1,4-benzoquinol methylase
VTGEFDLITCVFTLERVDDPAGALAWMKDRLAPNGTLLVEMPMGKFNRLELEQLAASLGLPYLYLTLRWAATSSSESVM